MRAERCPGSDLGRGRADSRAQAEGTVLVIRVPRGKAPGPVGAGEVTGECVGGEMSRGGGCEADGAPEGGTEGRKVGGEEP